MQFDLEKAHLLVTGGSGFMGSSFIRYVLKRTSFQGKLINLDKLTYASNQRNLSSIEMLPAYRFIHGDIKDPILLEAIYREYKPDAVIHFAAQTHVDRSIQDPLIFLDTNVAGTLTLLEWIRSHPSIHFHHISTDEVYGSLSQEGSFKEDSPYDPSSPYSASKAAADHFVRAYARTYGISFTLSHASNNYGPYQFPEKFIPSMILNGLQGKPFPIYGRGENIRDWLFVDDHSRAIWDILHLGKPGTTYNIGGGAKRSNLSVAKEIVKLLSEETNQDQDALIKKISFVPDRPGHDFCYALNCKKIQEEIRWAPLTDFQTGLRNTVKWYCKHQTYYEVNR